jgi:hypothetical protein
MNSATTLMMSHNTEGRRSDSAVAGLVLGAPEHDWSGTTNLAFYNNNAWLATGMSRIGAYLSASGPPGSAIFASHLLGNGTMLAAAVQKSLKAVAVHNSSGHLIFVPSYVPLLCLLPLPCTFSPSWYCKFTVATESSRVGQSSVLGHHSFTARCFCWRCDDDGV